MSTPTNLKLAGLLDRTAAVMDLLGENPFKVGAFQRGARVLEGLGKDVSEFPDAKSLCEIEGIGKGLAERIVEFVKTGRVKELDELLAKVPAGVVGLLSIPGLGPKSVAVLWKQGGVTSIEELKKKIATGELEGLPRMGKKVLEKIGKAVAFAEKGEGRVRIGDALPLAEIWVRRLREAKGVVRADYAGSLRRGRETIGDIDLLVSCRDPEKQAKEIGAAVRQMPGVEEVIASGATKVSVRVDPGMQVDVRIVREDQYGAALLYFTGSKDHNIALRERAIKRGMSLNEYGLWKSEDDPTIAKPRAARSEEEVYEVLKLAYIAPELREDRGEVDAAESGKLPALIELSDIKAELHAHTVASDGNWTIAELAMAAKARGFHTIAVTDHSVSQPIANGLTAVRLEKHIEAIRKAGETIKGITILAGSEVDILADGRLDYPDSLLAELDIVVASPHAALTQDPATATRRIIKAVENPYVHIIGHPTGRLIGRREGLSPDMGAVIKAAAATGTALEINANSWRLDLRDAHARAAVEAGVMLAINTDAHGLGDLDQLRYGILTARRAWVESKHVINCMTAGKLRRWLAEKRKKQR